MARTSTAAVLARSKPRKAAKKSAAKPNGGVVNPPIDPPADKHRVGVELKTGGTMTLTVSVDPIKLRGADRTFFYQVVDMLLEYAEENPSAPEVTRSPEGEGE